MLIFELDIERNRKREIRQRTLKRLTKLPRVWVEVYSTAIAVGAELMLEQYGRKAAVQLLSKAVEDVREGGIESLSKNLSALFAYYLVEAGRSSEAARVWSDHGLPCGVTDLVDLERQSWRTMEALSCARVRLLLELGESAAAEDLAGRLCEIASTHGLTRTLLRGLSLSMVVAHRKGDASRAQARLTEFLRVLRDVDYVRPLVRHREVSLPVLRGLLGTDPDDEIRRVAEFALVHVGKSSTATSPVFSSRELDVLAGLGHGLRNKEIASRLGITDEGVATTSGTSTARQGPPVGPRRCVVPNRWVSFPDEPAGVGGRLQVRLVAMRAADSRAQGDRNLSTIDGGAPSCG